MNPTADTAQPRAASPTPAALRARRSFLGLLGGSAAGLLVTSSASAQDPAPGDEFVTRTPADSARNLVMSQAENAVPLTLRTNPTQTGGTPSLRIENPSGRSAPYAQFEGVDRGNGTPYMTQIGGATTSQPFLFTNCFMTINGPAHAPFELSDLTIGADNIYMLGVCSDVGSAPAVVIQGGNNSAPLLRGYNYNGSLVAELHEEGQLRLPRTADPTKTGLLLGDDTLLYRSSSGVLRTPGSVAARAFISDTAPAGTPVVQVRRSGDQFARFYATTDGVLVWGVGNAAADVSLRRTNDHLTVNNSDLVMGSANRYFRWGTSANEQTSVGSAGSAATLPNRPVKYLKVRDSSGQVLVIPAFAA